MFTRGAAFEGWSTTNTYCSSGSSSIPFLYYTVTLDETEMVENDTVVLIFTATDADQPGTNNSRVFYYIDRRDDENLYELDPTTVSILSTDTLCVYV